MSDVVDVNLTQSVKDKYGAIARSVSEKSSAASCGCGPSCCGENGEKDLISANLYNESETAAVPADAILASLGCGNPTALAELKAGETVLDLGSGGGIDVLLSAKRVGPTGKAYGLDMTDDMLALALENTKKAGATNVEFLKGHIEAIPLPANTVDVIISNCVINLSGNKDQVIAEAFRVLKPGGRFAVSDVVNRREVPAEVRKNMELWIGCVAGALTETEYVAKLTAAGFVDITLEVTREYQAEQARSFLEAAGLDVDKLAEAVDGAFFSAFIRARKPGATTQVVTTPAVALEVFDPAMCCSTGVCGPTVDPLLAAFSADADWLTSQGVTVTRHNLAQEPQAFVEQPLVKELLQRDGETCLPIVMLNGTIVSQGAYPRREELARLTGRTPAASTSKKKITLSASSCCEPKSGCC